MSQIDEYLAELSARLHVPARSRQRILAEVRDHLDDALAQRQRADEARPEPGDLAANVLADFGAAPAIATQFNAEAGTRSMRRGPVVAFAGGLGVFGGFLLAGTTQSHSTSPRNATLLTQLVFFGAVLCFEVAVVAGVCAAARALAWWGASVAGSGDRDFVRRCSLVSTGALGVAAVAWCATMALASSRLVQPNSTTLILGGAMMLVSASIATVVVRRLPMNLQDDAPSQGERADGALVLAERSIGIVRQHPVLSCLVFAALSALPAMSHAEATLSGAVPWGLAQAASVVLGFIALGPLLGLRQRQLHSAA
ncbi:MAG: hypothetical protein M3O55_09830 [Actinomycetota bacterium]|nr:hypothetical protein [Actinomycetota bacterium]